MLAYTYVERGRFTLIEKPMPRILDAQDAIVRVTLASICASDLHIRQGSVPRAVPGVTVGHAGRRPRCRQCGNVLRRMLFLPKWLCEQLHASPGRLGAGLPDRRRPGAVCARAAGQSGPQSHSRKRERRAGPLCGRYFGHGLLGRADFADCRGRYGAGDRRGPMNCWY